MTTLTAQLLLSCSYIQSCEIGDLRTVADLIARLTKQSRSSGETCTERYKLGEDYTWLLIACEGRDLVLFDSDSEKDKAATLSKTVDLSKFDAAATTIADVLQQAGYDGDAKTQRVSLMYRELAPILDARKRGEAADAVFTVFSWAAGASYVAATLYCGARGYDYFTESSPSFLREISPTYFFRAATALVAVPMIAAAVPWITYLSMGRTIG